MTYEQLQMQNEKLNMQEMDLSEVSGLTGLYYNGNIAIEKNLSQVQKACVLAEELGHHYTSTGDILDQSDPAARKQELHARLWGYNKMVGLRGIINAYLRHCRTLPDMADYLEVTESFLADCLEAYRRKYGCYVELDNYVIMFEPVLAVMEKF